LLDLPLKFALPFLLWVGFYLRALIAEGRLAPRPETRSKRHSWLA